MRRIQKTASLVSRKTSLAVKTFSDSLFRKQSVKNKSYNSQYWETKRPFSRQTQGQISKLNKPCSGQFVFVVGVKVLGCQKMF